MDVNERIATRESTQKMRNPPGEPLRITASFADAAVLSAEHPAGPKEITLEATSAEGELASWFDDYWWIDLIERWGYDAVTLQIEPTPGALLHPVVLHQMEMVGRVAPRWRMVGHAYRSDVSSDDSVALIAASPYNEVRFLDQTRPGSPVPTGPGRWGLSIDELFGRIRREQVRIGATRPVLVRLPARGDTPSASAPSPAPDTVGAVASPS
ncbi:MAG: hypothetical protein ACE5HE_07510 [Phycisphaerae bacterium]